MFIAESETDFFCIFFNNITSEHIIVVRHLLFVDLSKMHLQYKKEHATLKL